VLGRPTIGVCSSRLNYCNASRVGREVRRLICRRRLPRECNGVDLGGASSSSKCSLMVHLAGRNDTRASTDPDPNLVHTCHIKRNVQSSPLWHVNVGYLAKWGVV